MGFRPQEHGIQRRPEPRFPPCAHRRLHREHSKERPMGHDQQVDLNAVTLTAELMRMPDFATPWTYLELKIRRPGNGVLFLAAHVPTDRYLRLIEDLSPGHRLSVLRE